jgi:CRISPR-associated exonuclease Cas4
MKYKIFGSLIQAYMVCPKQAWLMSRQITGDQYNEFLAIGRLISEESYKRQKKEILVEGGKIDFIKHDDGSFMLVEVKKSEKFLDAAKMQLLYYLLQLKNKGYNVRGEIRVPRSKKIITVELDDDSRKALENVSKEIEELIEKEKSPHINFTSKCKNCSYLEFCWS